jgi:two-component system cell cycle response regulator
MMVSGNNGISGINELDPGEIKILVVEDSPTQALQLQHLLTEKGKFQVHVAGNGNEALSWLEENSPTLVISDIVMPEVDGYELCRRIKAQERLQDVPILLLSTLSEPEDIIDGLTSGADNFLTKPYEADELLSRIEYILVNQSLRGPSRPEMSMDVFFSGKRYSITSNRLQIIDLLLSTYESALKQKEELERTLRELTEANQTIETLSGILPICAKCKQIRDDEGKWHPVESYVSRRSEAQFSHGVCPQCFTELYPEYTPGT